jgi:ferritin-like protein
MVMKQTAVEWLTVEAMKLFTQAMTGTLNEDTLEDDVSKIIIKAKEMEKEQHQEIFKQSRQVKIFEDGMPPVWENFEQYYNKIFKSE